MAHAQPFSFFGAGDLFDGGDMQCGKGNTSTIVKPNYHPIASRIYACVVRAWNVIAVTAAGHNHERLRGSGFEMMSDIFNHAKKRKPVDRFKQGETPRLMVRRLGDAQL